MVLSDELLPCSPDCSQLIPELTEQLRLRKALMAVLDYTIEVQSGRRQQLGRGFIWKLCLGQASLSKAQRGLSIVLKAAPVVLPIGALQSPHGSLPALPLHQGLFECPAKPTSLTLSIHDQGHLPLVQAKQIPSKGPCRAQKNTDSAFYTSRDICPLSRLDVPHSRAVEGLCQTSPNSPL